MGEELLNESVDGGTGLDEENHLARALKLGNEFLDRLGANDVGALSLVGEEVVHLAGGTVVGADGEALVVHVEDQVLTHDGKADEADIGNSLGRHVTCSKLGGK